MKRYRTESGVGAHDSNRIVYRVRNNAWVKVNRVLPDLTPEQFALFLGQCESVLDGRELAVLQYRNGLIGGREHTLEEVAAHFSVTRERIRQIENKALRKLKHHLKRVVT